MSAEPMAPRPFRVRERRPENADTVTVTLEPDDGGPALAFAPGQFTMLYAFGVGEVPVSISGDPGAGALVHTVRAVGAVSRAICAAQPGDTLGVRGPFGSAWPIDRAPGCDVILVAGGIGLAPLMPAFHALVARRAELGRLLLLVGARTPADLLFRDQLERWRGHFDLDVQATVDAGDHAWMGPVGVVTKLIERAELDGGEALAMLCGPEVMMRYSVLELEERGVDPGNIHVSLERNMKCALGHCGRCQLGPLFVCRDGPVLAFERVAPLLAVREL
jgi:NAD(P)H-flavin reductase